MSRNLKTKPLSGRSEAASSHEFDRNSPELNGDKLSRRNSHDDGHSDNERSEMNSPRKGSVVNRQGTDSPRKKKGKGRETRSRTPEAKLPFEEEDEFTDVTIKTGGGNELYSNRCLLSYTSPVFKEQLTDGSGDSAKENKGGKGGKGGGKGDSKGRDRELDMSDKKYEDVRDLLSFVDPRVDYTLTEEKAKVLLPLANEYSIKGLLSACGYTITQGFYQLRKKRRSGTVPIETTLDYLGIANKNEFGDLQKMCIDECVATDTFNNRILLDRDDISETVKVMIIDRKYESLKLRYAREQRARSQMESSMNTARSQKR